MGTYLNPGKAAFEEAVNTAIFVDKTEMVQYLNSVLKTKQKYVSVSRPRRFGKTMAADMICAYYDREADSRELFSGRKLAACAPVRVGETEVQWDTYLGQFDVIRLVMTDHIRRKMPITESLTNMQKLVIRELKKAYPDIDFFNEEDLVQAIRDVYSEINRQVIIVIDEWDTVFREHQNDKDGQTEYLEFLRDLLKDKPYIALAYMTGILPIKKSGTHSSLNMFTEYSMTSPMQLGPYTGFLEEEVKGLCQEYGRDYDKIREWYDGYAVNDAIPPDKNCIDYIESGITPQAMRYSLYNPLSIVKAVRNGHIMNYWNETETYEALAEYICRDYDGLKDAVALLMDGGRLQIDTSTYQNDMTTFNGRDDVLSLLIHLGYLGYNNETSEVFIPNREILDAFRTSTKSSEWTDTFRSFELSQEILRATLNKDAGKVAELVEKAHNQAGNRTYNDEAALSYAIQLAYYAARKYYTTILELDSGKGYVDIAYLPAPKYSDKPALVIELKYNKTADTAMNQIRRQKYDDRLEHYKGNILLVGIDYDKDVPNDKPEFKHHKCRIDEA